MKSKFLVCISAVALVYSRPIQAQQIPLTSQYMFNQLVVNPAVAGSAGHIVTRLVNRNQWLGIDGAPVTQTLSMHGLIEKVNLGLGGFVFRDQVGPFTQTGVQGAAAYHIQLTDEARLSLALQGGVFQYVIDASQLKAAQENDKVLQGTLTSIVPDATFGAYLYTPRYYVGASVPHIVAGRVKTGDIQVTNLDRHYLLIAGTYFKVSDEFRIEPSILGRYVTGQLSLDINTKIYYQNMMWIGASYRPQDAVVVLLGLRMFERLYIGYAYDITTNNLSAFSRGSHEVMLGFDIYPKTKLGRRPTESEPGFE